MADLNEILAEADKIKISIVMQVNLGDYKDSRSDAINKFHRAVESFNNQIYENCELIIVSDDCLKTQQHYNRRYKENSRIRFVYMDRSSESLQMNQTREGDPDAYKYYRGFARRIGVAAATGDVITYMDSDDILTPEFTITLLLIYNQMPELDWWINTSWYDNQFADWEESETMYDVSNAQSISLNGIDDLWKEVKLKPGKIVMTPWLLMHRSNLDIKWRDTYGQTPEYVDFNKRLREKYPNGNAYSKPIYVRAYYPHRWEV